MDLNLLGKGICREKMLKKKNNFDMRRLMITFSALYMADGSGCLSATFKMRELLLYENKT